MLYTYIIATLNITGISSPLKMQMLNNFLLRQDIDIALLQGVTNNDFNPSVVTKHYLMKASTKVVLQYY